MALKIKGVRRAASASTQSVVGEVEGGGGALVAADLQDISCPGQ